MKKWLLLVCMLAVLAGFPLAVHAQAAAPELKTLTTAQYDEQNKDNQVFVLFFSSDFCRFCQRAKTSLNEWLFSFGEGMENVHVYYVDTKRDQATTGNLLQDRFFVSKMPTFLVLVNNSVQYRHEGFSVDQTEEIKKGIMNAVDAFKVTGSSK